MTAFSSIYDGLADFMAALDPSKVIAFHASEEDQSRVEKLLRKQKETGLSDEEEEELKHFFILEHIVRMAKSRARLILSEKDQ